MARSVRHFLIPILAAANRMERKKLKKEVKTNNSALVNQSSIEFLTTISSKLGFPPVRVTSFSKGQLKWPLRLVDEVVTEVTSDRLRELIWKCCLQLCGIFFLFFFSFYFIYLFIFFGASILCERVFAVVHALDPKCLYQWERESA